MRVIHKITLVWLFVCAFAIFQGMASARKDFAKAVIGQAGKTHEGAQSSAEKDLHESLQHAHSWAVMETASSAYASEDIGNPAEIEESGKGRVLVDHVDYPSASTHPPVEPPKKRGLMGDTVQ
eukprot:c13210_g1_i3 orf=325-693(-)